MIVGVSPLARELRELRLLALELGLPTGMPWLRFRTSWPQPGVARIELDALEIGERPIGVPYSFRVPPEICHPPFVVTHYCVAATVLSVWPYLPVPPRWTPDATLYGEPWVLLAMVRHGASPLHLEWRWRRDDSETIALGGLARNHVKVDVDRAWEGLPLLQDPSQQPTRAGRPARPRAPDPKFEGKLEEAVRSLIIDWQGELSGQDERKSLIRAVQTKLVMKPGEYYGRLRGVGLAPQQVDDWIKACIRDYREGVADDAEWCLPIALRSLPRNFSN